MTHIVRLSKETHDYWKDDCSCGKKANGAKIA